MENVMECIMERVAERATMSPAQRFQFVNQTLSVFLAAAARLKDDPLSVTAKDLRALSQTLSAMDPEFKQATQCAPSDPATQEEIARYIGNLRSIHATIQTLHSVMLARKAQLDADRQHLCGLHSWISAYRHTA